MAIYREDIVDIELQSGSVFRSFTQKTIGEGDANGNRFGVRCFRNGQPVSLAGSTVLGHFIKPDGNTVEIDGGAVTGNTAFVTLPGNCYTVEGNFTLAIKLSGGGVTGTIRIVDGTVVNTTNGSIIDPGTGSIIPDLSAYATAVAAAEAAADAVFGITVTTELISGEDYAVVVTAPEGE